MTNLKRLAFTLALILSVSLLCHGQEQPQPTAEAPVPPISDAPVTSATGTPGKIPKFTTASNIEDSVMTENTSKIGINIAPTATLHVNGLQPGAVATVGKDAATLLQTSGAKGGNTTGTTGQKAGAGASLSLVAGNGGDAPSGSKNGDGGSITLQPGSGGAGAGTAGVIGNVLLAPSGVGNVAIGVSTAADKLTVKGVISSTTGGFKFPDGTTQTTAGLTSVVTGSGLGGEGTADSPLVLNGININSPNPSQANIYAEVADIISQNTSQGVALHLRGHWGLRAETYSSPGSIAVWGISTSTVGVEGDTQTGKGVYGLASSTGYGVSGYSTGGYGVRGETGSPAKAGVFGYNASGDGVLGKSDGSGNGVSGTAIGGAGVSGVATSGKGVYGQSNSNSGVFGFSGSGDGVTGQSSSGYAGHFFGKTKFTNNLEIDGSELFGNVTRQMINLYNTSYGIGIQASTLYFRVANTGGYNWYMGGVHNNTQNSPGTGGVSLMRLDSNGNLVVKGSVTATNISNPSDRALKTNFSSVNPRVVLNRLAAMPVQTWNYKSEGEGVRHMGPMAQDFKAAFNLGTDDKTISTVDTAGVTMAAVQGLYQLAQEKDRQIEQLTNEAKTLRSELDDLRARMLQLEEALKRQQK